MIFVMVRLFVPCVELRGEEMLVVDHHPVDVFVVYRYWVR